jgi:hypothetical protein
VFAALAHAGIVDDVNYSNAPGGAIVNARSIAQDPIFHSCGTVFEGSLKEDGVSYLSWEIPLKPRESVVITVSTNYTSLVLLILLIINRLLNICLF